MYMKKTLTVCALAIAMSSLGARSAAAQIETFMLVPGIPGDSIDERHKDWIDVLSVTQTLEAAGKKKSSCEIQVVKQLDIAGPRLWLAAVTAQIFPEVRVEVIRSGEDQRRVYAITLANARVSSIATAVSNTFVETLSLTAETATLTVFQQRPDGTEGPPVSATVSCK